MAGKPFEDVTEAYRELGYQSERFLARIRRWSVRQAWFHYEPKLDARKNGGIRWDKVSNIENQWVAIVEAHRSGWPHLNLLVYAPELAAFLESERLERLSGGATERGATLIHGELAELAIASGWGAHSTAERVRDRDAMAGYLTKLAGLAGKSGGELAKLTQAPLKAPERFRRLRSGKGFLPARAATPEDVTGTLVRRQSECDGTVTVLPLHRVPVHAARDVVACCYLEEDLAHRELAERARAKVLGGWFVGKPPSVVPMWAPTVRLPDAFRRADGHAPLCWRRRWRETLQTGFYERPDRRNVSKHAGTARRSVAEREQWQVHDRSTRCSSPPLTRT